MRNIFILVALLIFSAALVRADVNGPIPYQSSCDPSVNGGRCSTNDYCRCQRTPTGEHVCTQQMSCVYAEQCQSNRCVKDNSTCVIESRCEGSPSLCYAVTLFHPDLCPPSPTS